MNEEEAIDKLIEKIMELKVQGKTNSQIREDLSSSGVPIEIINDILQGIDEQISIVQTNAQRRQKIQTVVFQVLCVIVCAASVWAFVNFMQMDENLVPLNVFGINIIDTIVATGLASLGLSAFGTFFVLFGRYSD